MTANLSAANTVRSQTAAPAQVVKARAAIRTIRATKPSSPRDEMLQADYIDVLTARIKYADCTLAEVAATQCMTKDAYWSTLRRALAYAKRRTPRLTASEALDHVVEQHSDALNTLGDM